MCLSGTLIGTYVKALTRDGSTKYVKFKNVVLDHLHNGITAGSWRPGKYILVDTYIHVHTYIHVCTHILRFTHLCTCRHTYVCVCTHTHVHRCKSCYLQSHADMLTYTRFANLLTRNRNHVLICLHIHVLPLYSQIYKYILYREQIYIYIMCKKQIHSYIQVHHSLATLKVTMYVCVCLLLYCFVLHHYLTCSGPVQEMRMGVNLTLLDETIDWVFDIGDLQCTPLELRIGGDLRAAVEWAFASMIMYIFSRSLSLCRSLSVLTHIILHMYIHTYICTYIYIHRHVYTRY